MGCKNDSVKVISVNHKVITTDKPFSLQEKGWDEFYTFFNLLELSLISPLQRERLIINNNLTFLNSIFTNFPII